MGIWSLRFKGFGGYGFCGSDNGALGLLDLCSKRLFRGLSLSPAYFQEILEKQQREV